MFLEALSESHKFTFDLAPALFPLITAALKKGSTDRQAFSFAVTMLIPLIVSKIGTSTRSRQVHPVDSIAWTE